MPSSVLRFASCASAAQFNRVLFVQHSFHKTSKVLFCAAIAASTMSIPVYPVEAQASNSSGPELVLSDEQKWMEFADKQIVPILGGKPEETVRAASGFLSANPKMDIWQRSRFVENVANKLYYGIPAEKRHSNAQAVLALLDEGISLAAPAKQMNQIISQVMLQKYAINVALEEDLIPQAQQRLDSVWTQALVDDNIADTVRLRRKLYIGQDKEKEVVPMVRATILQRLQGQGKFDPALCLVMAQSLQSQGEDDQALSWAKLAFMLSPFDEAKIQEATELLAQAWMSRDLSSASVQAFSKAQGDIGSPNPLQGIALPTFDAPFQSALKAAITSAKTKGNEGADTLITLLLVQGDYKAAMVQARTTLTANMGSETGVRQIARVFKAKDLSIVRANQFLSYFQSGQGTNPMTTFFQEASPAAAPAPNGTVLNTTTP